MKPDFLLDSDVVIWHLRGRPAVSQLVLDLAARGRLGVSAITRAEVMIGMRDREQEATLQFLDACETVAVDREVSSRAAELVRGQRRRGRTLPLPDAIIAASALVTGSILHTCNARHYPAEGLSVREVRP